MCNGQMKVMLQTVENDSTDATDVDVCRLTKTTIKHVSLTSVISLIAIERY